MGKLIVFLIFGFIAYSVLKQLMKAARFLEPTRQQESQSEPETGGVATPEVRASKTAGAQDWADGVRRSYDLFKTGALTKEEFEYVKAQFLEKIGTEA
ncbi:hypothetical protein HR51_01665 [Burkholderia cepacia]|nr:hypothetical protein HR51_01665 [Burkholderia cepacia]